MQNCEIGKCVLHPCSGSLCHPFLNLHMNLLSGEDLGASFTRNPPNKGRGAGCYLWGHLPVG